MQLRSNASGVAAWSIYLCTGCGELPVCGGLLSGEVESNMKSRELKLSAIGVTTALAAFVSVAQGYNSSQSSQQKNDKADNQETTEATSQVTECKLSKLTDANVKSASGENLGDVEDLAINPRTGQIDYLILGRGGFLGIGEKRVPVPWQAVTSATHDEITLNVEKQKLQAAPSMSSDYSTLDNADFLARIDQYYGMSRSATGAAESPGGVEQGQQEEHEPK